MIHVSIAEQKLTHTSSFGEEIAYQVSTGKAGVGEQMDSGKTPRGKHIVRAMIGRDAPPDAVFIGRRWTGEHFSDALFESNPGRDWILSRILWLSGCEPGFNRLGSVDTMRRYIYIHGSPPEYPMGVPLSHGCVRMHPKDALDLFDRVVSGENVTIK